MKLSFSTVGCPSWTWTEIVTCAADLGFAGIELRGMGDDLSLRSVPVFQPGRVEGTAKALQDKGLSISCLASNLYLFAQAFDMEDARHTIDLARSLHCPYIRVLGDAWGPPGSGIDGDLVKRRLTELAPLALDAGVTLLAETNGVWAETAKLKRLIEDVDSPAVRVLWDLHHPYRYFGEAPETVYRNLGPYIKHVHIKDSVMKNGKPLYKMLTYGDLPLAESLALLKEGGFDGYLSMEWVKRWNDELEEPGVAFAHFVYSAEHLLRRI
ncbi:MAG: sugar phosphate isomerase/epimerase [Oscillospiraceae bacterium]|nr:sugar phosphate isomerase/epimerase [Oscillospiraceae bacterium]